MNRHGLYYFFLGFAFTVLVMFTAAAYGIEQINTPKGPVFLFSAQEMDKLEEILDTLVKQRDEARALQKKCTCT